MGRKVRRVCDCCSSSTPPGIGSKSLDFFYCSPFCSQLDSVRHINGVSHRRSGSCIRCRSCDQADGYKPRLLLDCSASSPVQPRPSTSPACLLHRLPSLNGVMPQNPPPSHRLRRIWRQRSASVSSRCSYSSNRAQAGTRNHLS